MRGGYLNEVSTSLSLSDYKDFIEKMENAYGAELQKDNEEIFFQCFSRAILL